MLAEGNESDAKKAILNFSNLLNLITEEIQSSYLRSSNGSNLSASCGVTEMTVSVRTSPPDLIKSTTCLWVAPSTFTLFLQQTARGLSALPPDSVNRSTDFVYPQVIALNREPGFAPRRFLRLSIHS